MHSLAFGYICLAATAKVSTGGLCPVVEIDPSAKIKLQLFPVDDATRAGLEKVG